MFIYYLGDKVQKNIIIILYSSQVSFPYLKEWENADPAAPVIGSSQTVLTCFPVVSLCFATAHPLLPLDPMVPKTYDFLRGTKNWLKWRCQSNRMTGQARNAHKHQSWSRKGGSRHILTAKWARQESSTQLIYKLSTQIWKTRLLIWTDKFNELKTRVWNSFPLRVFYDYTGPLTMEIPVN